MIILKDLRNHDGISILYHFNNSTMNLISSIFPEHNWLPWKFRLSSDYWKDLKNQRNFLEFLSKKLNIKDQNDWYKVTAKVN